MEEKELFYSELDQVYEQIKQYDLKIAMGDAKVETNACKKVTDPLKFLMFLNKYFEKLIMPSYFL